MDADDPDAVESPLAPLADLAALVMGKRDAGEPFLGYHYQSLGGQGAAAKGGAWDYTINGHQVAGFAAPTQADFLERECAGVDSYLD